MAFENRNSERLKAFHTTRYASSFNDESIYRFLHALDCPRSLAVWLLYSHKEHEQLASLDTDPLHYNSVTGFRDSYTATSFLSKADFLDLPVSKKDAAIKKFREYELLCKDTNNRFRNLGLDPNYHGPNVWLLNATIRKISEILGDFSADEFVDSAGWGPGVTTTLKGSEVSAFNKFHAERGITRDLFLVVRDWFPVAYPSWADHLTMGNTIPLDSCFSFESGNKIVTVPKNSKTDRVIAVEPGFNTWFQKACGTMIRRRLRREGVDLNTQERNQLLAREGSIDNSLATVDFSSASDSVSSGLVLELLPKKWYDLLDSCRSKVGKLDDEVVRWSKFSAMGNGFTFELESLIFYAAALAVCEYLKMDTRKVSVFGDDVIIPSPCYALYSSFSKFLGFRINPQKSFSEGLFRESCGAHYWSGVDCKPIFLKEKIRYVSSVFKLANSIRCLAHRRNSYYGCDSGFRTTWLHLYRGVPESIRLHIPLGFGDGGFVANFDEAVPTINNSKDSKSRLLLCPVRAGRGFEGYRFPLFAQLGISRESDHQAILIARLWQQSASSTLNRSSRGNDRIKFDPSASSPEKMGNTYPLRGKVRTRILPNVLTHQWHNLGPWL